VTSGVLVIDKPRGPTSHDVVAKVRRALHTREVGHAGTLDPMATGVLVVAVGEATKLVQWLTAHDKSYIATVHLGVGTTSLDAEGEITEQLPVSADRESIERALEAERARTEQVPPMVSAIKVEGVALHKRARRGEVLELAPRPVRVQHLAALRVALPDVDIAITCAKGYYVRSLARDLAARLGTVGHLTMLRRTESGPFVHDEAIGLEDVSPDHLIPMADAATRAIGSIELTTEGVIRARHGKKLAIEHFVHPPPEGPRAWLDQGELVAIGEVVSGEGRVLRGFLAPTTSS
jgi:tRNA pseudouridine55 synthase